MYYYFSINILAQVAKLPKDVYCTDIHWFPGIPGKKQASNQSELFALACTDGTVLNYNYKYIIIILQVEYCWCLNQDESRNQLKDIKELC